MTRRQEKNAVLGFWLALISIIAAIGVHVYLTQLHFKLKLGLGDVHSVCQISNHINCETSLASSYSEVFGIPLAFLGVSANLFLLWLLIAWTLKIHQQNYDSARARVLQIGAGLLVVASVTMAAVSAFKLHSWCPFCATAYVLSVVTCIGVFLFTKRSSHLAHSTQKDSSQKDSSQKDSSQKDSSQKDSSQKDSSQKNSLKKDLSQNSGESSKIVPLLLKTAAGFVIFALIGFQMLKTMAVDDRHDQMVQAEVQDWISAPVVTGDPVDPIAMGAEAKDAKVTIVEFADFLCGHCKHAFPVLKLFVRSHPDVRLEFQSFPLDGSCNKAMTSSSGTPCQLAYAVFCAHKLSKKGWDASAWLFENQERFQSGEKADVLLSEMHRDLKTDPAAAKKCMDDPSTQSTIRQQADLGSAWKIQGTPALFMNKKKIISGQNLSVLELIYRQLK
jgi:protein-disulfide isomerase